MSRICFSVAWLCSVHDNDAEYIGVYFEVFTTFSKVKEFVKSNILILSTFRELACMSDEFSFPQGYPDSKADVSSVSPSSFALKKGCSSKSQPQYLFTLTYLHYNSVDRTKIILLHRQATSAAP